MAAIKSRSQETVASVLEQSANPFLKDCMGKDALAYAQDMNDQNQAELVRQIETATGQWRSQVPEDELLADQVQFPPHCIQFQAMVQGREAQ